MRDFNGDAELDIAVANLGSHNATVLLGDSAGGFATATNPPVGVDAHASQALPDAPLGAAREAALSLRGPTSLGSVTGTLLPLEEPIEWFRE